MGVGGLSGRGAARGRADAPRSSTTRRRRVVCVRARAGLVRDVDARHRDPAPTPPAPGVDLEVHDAPTRHGRLSFALRWHGEHPALLWELTPPDGGAPSTA